MSKIRIHCKYCDKERDIAASKDGAVKGYVVYTLTCGHSKLEKQIKQAESIRDFIYDEKLRPHQREAVDFLENCNFRALIADEMRVGKTPETLAALRYNLKALAPILFVVKGSLRVQWAKEIIRWIGSETPEDFSNPEYLPKNVLNLPQIIVDGSHAPLPGFNFYIISMSVLHKHIETIKELKPRLVVIDESHNFKDDGAARTQALTKALKGIDPQPLVTCLSGSPILNRAEEFFTTLNLIRPDDWSYRQRFVSQWIDWNGRIAQSKREEFKEKTSRYILRREFHEVYKNDSKPLINYEYVDIRETPYKNAYNSQAGQLDKYLRTAANKESAIAQHGSIMGYIQAMWQITALAKTDYLCEKVDDFVELTQEKIIIGIHHEVVVKDLALRLSKHKPIIITGKDDENSKRSKREAFRDSDSKVLIASILACNEGVDLSFCDNMIVLQRQWNLEREKQFVARLQNLFRNTPYNVDYLLAQNTIDEFFTNMVSRKADAVNSAVKNEHDAVSRATLREFAEMCTRRI